MNKLKNKMLAGAAAPDKFAAAEAAMAAGGLVQAVATVAESAESARVAPAKAPEGKRPTRSGQAVRESLTLLPDESAIIDSLRLRLATVGIIPNRSELIRAGLLAMRDLDAETLAQLLEKVPKLKPGRPV
ncbi:hypothetical protein ZRA01_19030 [Zoogloea ramigera]|uniref:Uncharacterized protein n=1 Tax=Zoogloea ramigera TaxID=350 RepID=A0A4Y4CZ58_ZOORA|nr:hypothetical protein [Zoogloea ramigera]GEC95830.1 hypothetical protein ZRA01_19030 [Zoogloea ramigera]